MAHPSRSRFADASAAREAVERSLPLIEPALRDTAVSGLGVLHLVVLDPGLTPADCAYAEAVLHEHSIGQRALWDVDYAAYAHAKARLAWRHACDSRRVLAEPHRLAEDDRLVWGGVWLEGIVVAASGAMPAWDEAFSLAVAAQMRAIAYERARAARPLE